MSNKDPIKAEDHADSTPPGGADSKEHTAMIENVPFCVDESPYCVWDQGLDQKNQQFIRGLAPAYFAYLGQSLSADLERDQDRQMAATALRSAYVHSLESAFAITFAALQAPSCLFGWLEKYRPENLKRLVLKAKTDGKILNRHHLEKCTWSTIVKKFLARFPEQATTSEGVSIERDAVATGFTSALRNMASDFLDETTSAEYNAIKHGFRISTGGFAFGMRPEKEFGKEDASAPMSVLASSKFGSSGFLLDRIAGNKIHHSVKQQSRNWNPGSLAQRLQVVSAWLFCVKAALQWANRDLAPKPEFRFLPEQTDYEKPWQMTESIPHLTISTCELTKAPKHSAAEVLATYKQD